MRNVLVVLPTGWKVDKIRYCQYGDKAYLVDADLIESPLDSPNSLLNYHSKVVKLNGPTGFQFLEGPLDRERQMREDPPEWAT